MSPYKDIHSQGHREGGRQRGQLDLGPKPTRGPQFEK